MQATRSIPWRCAGHTPDGGNEALVKRVKIALGAGGVTYNLRLASFELKQADWFPQPTALCTRIHFKRDTTQREQTLAKITGGRFIAEFLNAQGVTAFFFVPTMLSRALAEMDNMPIKRVLTHGEKAAAYMADGYARASGLPGICAAQAVGAANLAAGLRDAYMGHSPVIALTGGRWGHQKHKINYQEMDDFPIFTQVTKANFQVDTVGRLPDLLRQAFREAPSGPSAPVNLLFAGKEGDIESDVADLKVIEEEVYAQVPAHRPAPEGASVAEAARILKKAKRPVIVVGGGARWSGAAPEVLKLAKALSIPVATSL